MRDVVNENRMHMNKKNNQICLHMYIHVYTCGYLPEVRGMLILQSDDSSEVRKTQPDHRRKALVLAVLKHLKQTGQDIICGKKMVSMAIHSHLLTCHCPQKAKNFSARSGRDPSHCG